MSSTQEKIGAEHGPLTGTLLIVYGALMLLLGTTVLVAYSPLGRLNIVLAILIALTKAGLVIWFFMHFKHAQKLVAVLFASSVFILLAGAILSFADYLTR